MRYSPYSNSLLDLYYRFSIESGIELSPLQTINIM